MIKWQSSGVPTISLVAPLVLKLINACDSVQSNATSQLEIKTFCATMVKELKTKFSCLNNPVYALATFLDPRTKQYFKDLPASVQEKTKSFVLQYALSVEHIATPPSNDSDGPHDKRHKPNPPEVDLSTLMDEDELSKLINETMESISEFPVETNKSNVLDVEKYLSQPFDSSVSLNNWFKLFPAYVRHLYIVICSIPGAAAEVERLFSCSGNIVSKRRCSLHPVSLSSFPLSSILLLSNLLIVVEECRAEIFVKEKPLHPEGI